MLSVTSERVRPDMLERIVRQAVGQLQKLDPTLEVRTTRNRNGGVAHLDAQTGTLHTERGHVELGPKETTLLHLLHENQRVWDVQELCERLGEDYQGPALRTLVRRARAKAAGVGLEPIDTVMRHGYTWNPLCEMEVTA